MDGGRSGVADAVGVGHFSVGCGIFGDIISMVKVGGCSFGSCCVMVGFNMWVDESVLSVDGAVVGSIVGDSI